MVSIRKAGGAIVAGLMLTVSLGQVMAPTTAMAATSAQSQSASQSTGKAKLERTDAAYDGSSTPMISMIEGREFRLTAPVEGKSVSELESLIKDGKVTLTLSRAKGQFSKKTYPKQWLGGKLGDWKTVATQDGAAEGGNGNTADERIRKSREFFYDVELSAKEVDGTPSVVASFKNRELYEGIDGIDVRSREFVRSSLYDYVGTYSLACDVDGTKVASTKVDLRPYDAFATQEDIDAQLPELAKRAKANGLYAEVRTFGTSAQGRPMRALFVAKQKSDLDDYQALKKRMEKDPASVQADLAAGKLKYKVPVVYSNVHADEIVASDAVMEFARDLAANKPIEYRRATGLTGEGKAELKTEMDHDRTVWSDLVKDDVTGIGYVRGDGGKGHGTNYDGADTDNASSDLSEEEFEKYYDSETQTFDPSKSLDDVFYILVPSENVDARAVNVRTNGTGFDLNRDNTYQTQPETQAMSGLITQWDPISLHEVHGYYQQYQVEPCSPTHDPNNEYDLFIDTALAQGEAFMGASIANNPTINSVQMPMRDYLKLQDDGTRFWEAPFDDMSTSYTPQYAMMHGTNAYTVEAPYGTADAVDALRYGFIGNADFVVQNKDRMFNNQLERFRRGVQNIDADNIRPYYVSQKDEKGAEADTFRPRDSKDVNGKTNGNFFPEYYVIPMDADQQNNRPAAAKTVDFLIHNGVEVKETTKGVKVGDKTYPTGTMVVDMHQAKRNMANCALYPNLVIDDWTQYSLYSEPVTNFSAFRGYDMDTIRTKGAFAGSLQEITQAPGAKTAIHERGQGRGRLRGRREGPRRRRGGLRAGRDEGEVRAQGKAHQRHDQGIRAKGVREVPEGRGGQQGRHGRLREPREHQRKLGRLRAREADGLRAHGRPGRGDHHRGQPVPGEREGRGREGQVRHAVRCLHGRRDAVREGLQARGQHLVHAERRRLAGLRRPWHRRVPEGRHHHRHVQKRGRLPHVRLRRRLHHEGAQGLEGLDQDHGRAPG